MTISIILPCKNEAPNLAPLLKSLMLMIEEHAINAEILVVNDGSSDDTAEIVSSLGCELVSHPYSKGNGASIKSGAMAASGDILVFMDGDGQHDPADIPKLLARLDEGYDMIVGARKRGDQASFFRMVANGIYKRLASWMVGHKVLDLTSGFRVVRADKFREFISFLPNGFSYPTTITMAFFRAGYNVGYEPIDVSKRGGSSHINLLSDGLKFLLIIFKVGTLYSPLKLFTPLALLVWLMGMSWGSWVYFTDGRFTNMTTLLLMSSVLIFVLGLISEQITTLLYKDNHVSNSRR